MCTVNSLFKKDLKLQIHLHKAFFSDDRFLDSPDKSFLNQTTLNLRKEKRTFLNREFTVPNKKSSEKKSKKIHFFCDLKNFFFELKKFFFLLEVFFSYLLLMLEFGYPNPSTLSANIRNWLTPPTHLFA